MWKEMGYLNQPAIFSKTETPITLIVLVLIGSMVLIKNSFKALMLAHLFIALGFALAGICTFFFVSGRTGSCMVDDFCWLRALYGVHPFQFCFL
jgi:hypothetical protein